MNDKSLSERLSRMNSITPLLTGNKEVFFIFIALILSCFFSLVSVYAAEITYDENGVIQFKNNYKTSDLMHNKIKAYLSEMDSVLAKISKETDYELCNFFNTRKINIKAFAQKASCYYRDTDKNRIELQNMFNEYIFSEKDINNLVEGLLISGSKKLQTKFIEILYLNGIINTKNTDLNNLIINHQKIFIDTSYMDKNKINTICKVAEFVITIPLKFVHGLIAEFLIFRWLPYNQYNAEDEIANLIIKQIDNLKIQIYDEIGNRFKDYNKNLKDKLRELLIKKFDE